MKHAFFVVPCEFAEKVAILEHTYLKNNLVEQIGQNLASWTALPAGAPLPRVLQGLPVNLASIRSIVLAIEAEFSPSLLVDRGVLAVLPVESKDCIRKAVHAEYWRLEPIQLCRRQLEESFRDFEVCVKRIPQDWRANRRPLLCDLKAAAEDLRMALLQLPEGIVVP